MSFVIWILTSNNCRRLPAPLLSRCPPIHLREVSIAELVAFAQREGSRRGLGDVSIEAVGDALVRQGESVRPSLRTVMRMLERAATLEDVSARLH